jgi:fatty-acyl-CoA synthase
MTDLSFEALTPTAFLDRSAGTRPDAVAVLDGSQRWTYAQLLDRCLRMSGAMRALGIAPGSRVAVLAPNTHVLLEAHYGVPLAGAVLVSLNVRLTARELGYILAHSGAEVLIYDPALGDLAGDARRARGLAEADRDR